MDGVVLAAPKIPSIFFALVGFLPSVSSSQESAPERAFDERASEVIRRADRVRAPSEPFKYSLTLVEVNDGRETSRQGFEVFMRFFKPNENSDGDARALVRFTDPPAEKGKSLLAVFDKLWYYEPKLRRPIAISKQQRLLGQVSNGDVVATDYDLSYFSRLEAEETCGETVCYRLALERRAAHVIYPRISYWVERETYRPYRADFLSTAGGLIKRAWYKDYRKAEGVDRPHEILIEDGLKRSQYTRMLYSNLRLEEVPDVYFQKEYLMRLR